MYKIEYEIKINDEGRPYIHLPEDYDDIPENRFFAMEITKYILNGVAQSNKSINVLSDTTKIKLAEAGILIGQVSDEIAVLLKEQMKLTGELDKLIKLNYDFHVSKYEDLNNLNPEGIIRNNKIYKLKNGLRVMILDQMQIYMYEDGKWILKED